MEPPTALMAAEHLLGLGHRRLAVISFGLHRGQERGTADLRAQAEATYAVTRDRLAGYRTAATRAGLDWSQVPVVAGTDSTVTEGAAAAGALFDPGPAPTAILCLSDRLAEGATQVARARGLRIPEDLAVIGFDDAQTADRLGLTTIRQPSREKGEIAAQALLALIEGHNVEPAGLLATELVVRASTGGQA